MFYKFNAHRTKKTDAQETSTDRLAKKIAAMINSVQQGWATIMNKAARKLPTKWLKAIVLLLVLAAGAYCTHLISGGLFSRASMRINSFEFQTLWPFDPMGDKHKLRRQAAWESYLDSLEREVQRDSLENPQYYQP